MVSQEGTRGITLQCLLLHYRSFIYNSFVIVPRHKRYRKAFDEHFYNLTKEELINFFGMTDEEKDNFMDKLAEEVKIEVNNRSR